MPLQTQPTGLETKAFIPLCGYKFISRQQLVNVPLEEKKGEDNHMLHDKRVKKEVGEGCWIITRRQDIAAKWKQLKL